MRSVVERAFATSSNATVCTHIGLPPSRIAIATSSPSGAVVSGSTTTSAPSSSARPAIVDASGTSPRVFQLSTVTDAASPATARAAGAARRRAPRRCRPRRAASTTAIAMPNARVRLRDRRRARSAIAATNAARPPRRRGARRRGRPPTGSAARTPCGHSSTAATRAVPSTTAQPRMRGSIPSTLGEWRGRDPGRGRRSAGSRR